jgi:hypothetical protein
MDDAWVRIFLGWFRNMGPTDGFLGSYIIESWMDLSNLAPWCQNVAVHVIRGMVLPHDNSVG